jgi:hypothetical protein
MHDTYTWNCMCSYHWKLLPSFDDLLNHSGYTSPCGILSLYQKWVPEEGKQCFWPVERGRCVRLTTLPPSVSRLSRQCVILSISHAYRPPRPITGIALLYFIIDQQPLCVVRKFWFRLSLFYFRCYIRVYINSYIQISNTLTNLNGNDTRHSYYMKRSTSGKPPLKLNEKKFLSYGHPSRSSFVFWNIKLKLKSCQISF